MLRPFEPALFFAHLPPVGGKLGDAPEDFCVEEIPLYPFAGEGQHLFVQLRKRGMTTQQLAKVVANVAGVRDRDIGIAGQKDKQAVTTQWFSLLQQNVPEPSTWPLPEGVEVLQITHHNNKLRTGHLSGNRFRIRLRGVLPEALTNGRQICDQIREHGLPNYYGAQRFGVGEENLSKALAWLAEPGRGSRLPRFLTKLYPSVVQAEIFNRYVTLRLAHGLRSLLPGEVVRLNNSSSVFVVTDPAAEATRLGEGDIHLTGPMWGPKTRQAEGAARDLELAALSQVGISDEQLGKLAKFAPGTRRDVLLRPEELTVHADVDDPGSLVIQFGLPAGAYATELIRQFTHDAFTDVRGPGPG